MIDVGERNILEEKTAQDVADSIRAAISRLNDGNAKTVYVFLKDTESRIEEAIRRIDKIEKLEEIGRIEEIKKISEPLGKFLEPDGKPPTENLLLEDFLMISANVEVDGKILSVKEKLVLMIKRIAKRNWEEVLKMLQEDCLPTVSNTLNLCETPRKVELTNPIIQAQEIPTPTYLDNISEEKGVLKLSTMEVKTSINEVAAEVQKQLGRRITQEDLKGFKKAGGKPYSKNTIRKAVEYANINAKNKILT